MKAKNTFQIQLLGGFSIKYEDKVLSDSEGRTKKLWTLIEFLLTNYGSSVSQEKLIEAVWADEEFDNPLGALKNLVYRARTLLKVLCPEGKSVDFILFERNTYAWNPKLPCEIDIRSFEAHWKAASNKQRTAEERILDYQAALDLYKGEFLPKSAYLDWVIGKNAYYASLYQECALELAKLLYEKQDFEQIVLVCEAAIVHCPYEEKLHQALLYAYGKTKQEKKAVSHYQHIAASFYDEFGVQLNAKTVQIYKDIVKTMHNVELDLSVIKEDLREAGEEAGAFSCDYDTFKQIYRLQARSIQRNGLSIHVALLTLTDEKGDIPNTALAKQAMKRLRSCVIKSLRKGDVVSLYSAAQLVVMLPLTSYEDGNMVLRRIKTKFDQMKKNLAVQLQCRLTALDPVDFL